MNIKTRVAALEKTMNIGGGHCHLVIAHNDEEADRKVAEIKERDPNATCILSIIRPGRMKV